MKKNALLLILTLSLIAVLYATSPMPQSQYTPVYMSREGLDTSVFYAAGGERALQNPGKIYYKSPYIYVNERYKGVHVINNGNPQEPVKEGFIVAPGCIDMAIKGDILYVDNAVDLVAFDLINKEVTERIRAVLPEPYTPENTYIYQRPDDMILVGWEKNY